MVARRSQPPADFSAMDGYAVRAGDVTTTPVTLEVIGAVPAGQAFEGTVGAGQCVRIFTGAPLPAGADSIVIQENTTPAGKGPRVTINEAVAKGRYVRPKGLDFSQGAVGLVAGSRLGAADIGLAAAMNVPWLTVRRRPRVALLANGDELVRPGDASGPNQIICSNNLALAAEIEAAGGEASDLGIAADTVESLRRLAAGAAGADLLVTMGGASVGDHDLVQKALGGAGLEVDFWKIAMRPGKPLIFGRLGDMPMLGLPGNPVSALVCAHIFLYPLIDRMLGGDGAPRPRMTARLGAALKANDRREDYLRATLRRDSDGTLIATPFTVQDSSVLSGMAHADCLAIRRPDAPALAAGAEITVIPLRPLP